jgi:hypothetical protein
MARYYLDIRDGDELAVDEEGLELLELRAVQAEAAKSLADVARDAVNSFSAGNGGHRMAIEVRDASGPVMQVQFIFEVKKLRQ